MRRGEKMDDAISRKGTSAWLENMGYSYPAKVIMDEKRFPSVLGTNLAEVGTDCISRQAAIDALSAWMNDPEDDRESAFDVLKQLPCAQPEISMDQIKIWLDAWEGYVDKDIIARMKYRVIDIPFVQTREETT
jgi:hypothetical protein